jgi:hypothetical protein
MRIGPFEIKVALEYQIWEGRSLKYRLNSLDEAIDLADNLWEEDREREDAAQYGDGTRAMPERRGMYARTL